MATTLVPSTVKLMPSVMPVTPGAGTGNATTPSTTPSTMAATTTGSGLAPGVTPIDPATDLRNSQITPGAMLDRFGLAQQQFDTFANATTPAYQAALRDATRAAAGAGRLGSGMLRTSYGDLANQRNLQLDTQRENLFQNALQGSVGDAQTQFQDLLASQNQLAGMQNQAFNQGVTGANLQEALTSGSFSRALQTLAAGLQGDPTQTQLALSKIFGDQSAAAGSAMSGLLGQIMGGGESQTDSLLRQILLGQQQQTATPGITQAGTPTGSYPNITGTIGDFDTPPWTLGTGVNSPLNPAPATTTDPFSPVWRL